MQSRQTIDGKKWEVHFRRHRLFLCKSIEKLQLIASSDAPQMIFPFFLNILKILDVYLYLSINKFMHIYLEICLFTSKGGESKCMYINIGYLFVFISAKSYLYLFASNICQLWCQSRGGGHLLLLPNSNLPSLAMILNTNTNNSLAIILNTNTNTSLTMVLNTKGSHSLPNRMLFYTLCKRPLTPPPRFTRSCCGFFDINFNKCVNVFRDKILYNSAKICGNKCQMYLKIVTI